MILEMIIKTKIRITLKESLRATILIVPRLIIPVFIMVVMRRQNKYMNKGDSAVYVCHASYEAQRPGRRPQGALGGGGNGGGDGASTLRGLLGGL